MTYYKPSEATVNANISMSQCVTAIMLDQPNNITGYTDEPITISGHLIWFDQNGYNRGGLKNAPIELYVNNSKKDQKNTDNNGKFTFSITFDQPGTYTIKVRFPGMTR